MKQIRQNVFETNSSSSHSISIRKADHYVTHDELLKEFALDIKYKDCRFYDFELIFGRSPFEVLSSFKEKLRFAFASYSGLNDADAEMRKEIRNIIDEVLPELGEIQFDEKINYCYNEDYTEQFEKERVPFYGQIDHQSMGVLSCFLKRKNISMKEFLTNTKYVVFIDGDEYQVKEHLFDIGLFHLDDFEEI
jgi:hypothetical protein